MKYRTFTTILFLCFTAVGYSDVQINWANTNPINNNSGNPIAPGSIFQLIWTATPTIVPFDPLNALTPGPGSILLDQQRNSAPNPVFPGQLLLSAQVYNSVDFGLLPGQLVGGHVFVRVFDYQGSASQLPDNIFYIEGALSGPLPNRFDIPAPTPATANITAGGPVQMVDQFVAIPEPGTVALFLMGGVMMMIRHRRKRFLGR